MNKFLIIRFSSIGDIVLTSPIIRCIKKSDPSNQVHFLTKYAYEDIIKYNPYLDKYFLLGHSLKPVIIELQEERYDYIIDLHHNIRSWLVKRKLNGVKYAFNKLNWQKWVITKLKVNKLPKKHIVERYFDTVKILGIYNDLLGLDFFIPEEQQLPIDEFPEDFRSGYVAIVIGAKHYTKKLPVEKLIELCQQITKPIILLGGQEDQIIGQEVNYSCDDNIYNVCGKYSFIQSASIIKNASKVITHDTGLMHVAAAFKKPIISIWGNTIPEFGMTPYLPIEGNLICEVSGLACRPCSKIGHHRCPEGHFKCMKLQNTRAIAAAVNVL